MIATFDDFFGRFSSYLNDNFSRPVEQDKERIRNGPKRIRRLDSLARLIIRENTENCAAVGLVNNRWLMTANNLDKIRANADFICQSIKKIYSDNGRVRTKLARQELLTYLAAVSYVPNIDKLNRDVRKFLSSLKTNDIFTKKEINNLLEEGFKNVENKKGFHAEINLLLILLNTYKTKIFKAEFGISKLCCRLCAAGIAALRETHPNLDVQVRGRHGNFYFEWKPSQKLFIENEKCFSIFVGNEAFVVYKKAGSADQGKILAALSDLSANRTKLEPFFTPQREAVNTNSESPAPPDTESPQQPDTETESDEVYYSKTDTSGDSED